MARGRGLCGAPGRRRGAVEGIGHGIEVEPVLLPVDHRQHGPGQAYPGAFATARSRMGRTVACSSGVTRCGSRRRAAPPRTGRAPEVPSHGWSPSRAAGPRTSRRPWRRSGARSSCSSKIVGLVGAVVGLGPEVRPAHGVHDLHGDAQRRSRLADAALHDVARPQLLADRAYVEPLAAVTARSIYRATTKRWEKRESPVTMSSVEAVGKGLDVRIACGTAEGQHGDPGTSLAHDVGARRRRGQSGALCVGW